MDYTLGLSLRAEETLTEADRSYYKTEGQSFSQYLSTSRMRGAEDKEERQRNKKSTKDRKLVKKLQVLAHSLKFNSYFCIYQAVGCPYLEGMDEAVVSEVVLAPGEARMRVLTWLTGRCVCPEYVLCMYVRMWCAKVGFFFFAC